MIVDEKPLQGSFEKPESIKSDLSRITWHNGVFQQNYSLYKKDFIGFRNTLIRIYNQYQYSLFELANTRGVITAKNNMVISEGYIETFFGDDYIGADSFIEFLEKAKYVQDSLAKREILLLFLVAPGKAAVYPENIPDHYFEEAIEKEDNYHSLISMADEKGINIFDARAYIVENKNKFEHPIFPSYGIHWSGNTVAKVADTLINYINSTFNYQLPTLSFLPGETTVKNYRFTDYDIGESMNLLWFAQEDSLYYPKLHYTKNSKESNTTLLGVGDSFFQSFIGFYPILDSVFSKKSRLWFYNKTIAWPKEFEGEGLTVSSLDLELELAKTDIIIVETTDENIKMIGYNFIDDLYNLFTKGGPSASIKKTAIQKYGSDLELLNLAESLYPIVGYTKEQMIQTLALKKMKDSWKEEFDFEAEVEKVIELILSDKSGWLEKVKQQALRDNVTLEESIRDNAVWVVNKKLEE